MKEAKQNHFGFNGYINCLAALQMSNFKSLCKKGSQFLVVSFDSNVLPGTVYKKVVNERLCASVTFNSAD